MRLMIHAGLHKTATTYFQEVLRLNRGALRELGIYTEPDRLLPANHGTAWMAVQGDARHVHAHVEEAKRLGCSTVVLSSEDFEELIFEPKLAVAVEQAGMQGGAEQIEWHFGLRDPGEYLASIYAEMNKHLFVDFLSMFSGAARDGRAVVVREPRRLPLKWVFCFDYERYFRALAAELSGTVSFHDFRDLHPFPMHQLFEHIVGNAFRPRQPDDWARNARHNEDQLSADIDERLAVVAERGQLGPDLIGALSQRSKVPLELRSACAAALSRLYAPGMERLLAEKVLAGGKPYNA